MSMQALVELPRVPVESAEWRDVCAIDDVLPGTGVAASDRRRADRHRPHARAGSSPRSSNFDPFSNAFVIARGIVGDRAGVPKIASPIYKQNFSLETGECLDDPSVRLAVFPIRVVSRSDSSLGGERFGMSARTDAPALSEALPRMLTLSAPSGPVKTHCPYCAFQCGMTVTPRASRRVKSSRCKRTRTSRSTAARCASRASPRRAARSPAARAEPAAARRDGQLAPVSWDTALDFVAERIQALHAAHGAATHRHLRQRRAHQREGVPARQVRARGAQVAEHRLQRALLHVVGGGRAEPRVRHRSRAALSGLGHRRDPDAHALGLQLRRDDAAHHAVGVRAATARRQADRRRSALHRHRAHRHAAPAAHAGHRSGAGQRPAVPGARRKADRSRVHRRAHRGLRGARAQRAHQSPDVRRAPDRRADRAATARGSPAGRRRVAAWCCRAAAPSSSRRARTRCCPSST